MILKIQLHFKNTIMIEKLLQNELTRYSFWQRRFRDEFFCACYMPVFCIEMAERIDEIFNSIYASKLESDDMPQKFLCGKILQKRKRMNRRKI